MTPGDEMTPEDAVRAFFDAYSEGQPQRLEELVSPQYIDYGHTPPGTGVRAFATTTNTPSGSPVACPPTTSMR